jgi:predicted DNA-binding transcriptional regulator YafY
MGKEMFEEASRAIEKNQANQPVEKLEAFQHFDSFRSGSIDYSPYQETILTLIDAMNERKICRVTYKSIISPKAKSFYIKPLKIFSHKDSVYVHAQLARAPGKPYVKPQFDPLLAIHRIKKVELTERKFKFPANYDFDKAFKQNFGVIKEDAFKLEVEFTGWAARYVSERIWSPDQKIHKKNGKTKITFSASSEPEVTSWVLSFCDEAKVLKPIWLKNNIKSKISSMSDVY